MMFFRPAHTRFHFGHYLALTVLALVCATAQAVNTDRGLLWKIESPEGKTSHLFGTIHLEDERVTRLPGPVQRVFDQASRVTLEISMDPAALISLSVAMMLTDGRDLQGILGDDLYRRALAAMEEYGMPELVVRQMKPWAVATTLLTPEPETGVVLDMKLYQDAAAAGKQVDGLETVAEQLGVFDSLEEKLQVRMLEETLDNRHDINRLYAQLLEVYLQRDLAKMVALNESYMALSDRRLAETVNQRIIVERNHRMADRMESRFRAGNAFIAVGVLHLPGKQGVLSLLERRGYRVSRVY